MTPSPAARLGRVALVTGASVAAYAVVVERRWYAVRHEVVPALPPGRRLRVLFFADLHFVPRQGHRLAFVRRMVRRYAPDVLVSGGDNLESASAIEPIVELHHEVLADGPVAGLAVLGSHDRYGPRPSNPLRYLGGPSGGPGGERLDTDRLIDGLERGGWRVLVNQIATVDTPAGRVQVVGVDDPHIDRDDLSVVPDRVDGSAVLRLGLVHAPYQRVLGAFDRAGFDLALAGHTHGGQVAVPGWGALVTNSDLPAAQAKGSSWFGADLRLHVSAGLGHSVYFPFRFACRPELTVLDLVGSAEA